MTCQKILIWGSGYGLQSFEDASLRASCLLLVRVHLESEDNMKEDRHSQYLACNVKKAKDSPKYGLEVLSILSSAQKTDGYDTSYLMDASLRMQVPDWMTTLKDCCSYKRDSAQKRPHEAHP